MRCIAVALVVVVVAAGAVPGLAREAGGVTGLADGMGGVTGFGDEATRAQEEGTVIGRPSVELSATDNRFGAGERATLELFVSNTGDLDRGGPAEYERRVTTARNVRLEIDETRMDETLAGKFQVQTGTVLAGSVPEGISGPFAFDVEISDSLAPGTYQLPVRVSYDYTNFVRYGPNTAPEYNDGSLTTTKYVTVVVEDRPRFEVRVQNLTRVTAGDTATYTLNVTNTGTTPAIDAQVNLSAANSSVFFGGADAPEEQTSFFFERLDPGETRSFEVTVGASADTAPGTYLANAVVNYESPNGVSDQSKRLAFGIAVGEKQRFEVRGVDGTLRVGDTGLVTGQIVNAGETDVSDAVVVLGGNDSNFAPRATEFAVGNLSAGEATNFSFRIATSNATDPGPRRLTFRVEYRNPAGEARASDPIDAQVAVAREQTFGVSATATGLQVGERGTISGTVVNTGEVDVSDAVVVLQTEGTNLQPEITEFAAGTLRPGEATDFDFEVSVPDDADPGVRQVSFRVRYRNADGDRRFSDALDANVRVEGERTFAVSGVESDLQVGDSGTVSGTVVNTGETAVTDAVVVFGAEGSGLQPRNPEVSVGRLEPSESVPFEFTVDVPNESDSGPRQISFRVRYRNRDGDPRASDEVDARVVVGTEQRFAVESVESDLRVGDAGDLTGRVVNAGNRTVSNAVVVLQANDPALDPRETEFAVGRLEPGESVPFEFTVDVAGETESGPRQVSFRVRYRNRNGDSRMSDAADARVVVAEEVDEFRVEPVNATVASGGSGVVTFRVTNAVNQTLRNVEAELFTSDPLSSDDDEAFVSRLPPGESTVLKFRIEVADDAILKTYPVSMDFVYENERGDTVRSDTYRMPVDVTERRERDLPIPSGVPVAGLVAGGVAIVALGLLWWKRKTIARLLS